MIGFGEFSNLRYMEIKSLSDERLMLINPTAQGFYDRVLQFKTEDKDINAFIRAVYEVQEAELTPFWRLVMDPSEIGGKITYLKRKLPAIGHSYNWWKDEAEKMPSVEDKIWLLGSEYQYYADEVDLINQLVEAGYPLDKAIEGIVLNSTEFGHYVNSKEAKKGEFERTGSRELCGRYDLGNTCKILRCSDVKVGGFWIAGGSCKSNGRGATLADLKYEVKRDFYSRPVSVGWYVLESKPGH